MKGMKRGRRIQETILDFVAYSFDFVNAVLPLLIPLNPPVVIFFALVAKGIGLISVNALKIYQNVGLNDREKVLKEMRKAFLSMFSSGADFVNTSAPFSVFSQPSFSCRFSDCG